MADLVAISKHFQMLRSHDPRLYDMLLSLVEDRVMEVTVAVSEAPPDQVLVAQGMAREARKWLKLMTEPPVQKAAGQQAQQPDRPAPTPRGP